MRYSLVFWAAPALLTSSLVHGYGNSVIENKCGDDVYFWEDNGEPNPPMQTITPGNSYTKELYQTGKAGGAGPSFKITTSGPNGALPVFDSSPITQFEYTCNAPNWPGFTSFDISNVNGGGAPPFVKGGVSVSSPQDPSATKTCPANQNPCTQGYTAWNDDKWAMVQTADSNDIVMTLCGPKPGTVCGGGGPSSGGKQGGNQGGNQGGHQDHNPPPVQQPPSSSSPPPPSSSSSAAPPPSSPAAAAPVAEEKIAVPKAAAANNDEPDTVVTITKTAAPVYVTEWAMLRDRSPHEEEMEKRAEHVHQHAHAHNKFNKRRHGA